uniref:Uncharacterized protein n=1 Tax=Oryza meridionalis TaxID=40149 RepID=A0A0E0CRK4_9ORYZ
MKQEVCRSTSLRVMALERTVWYSMAFVTAGLLRKPPVSPQSHAALPTSPSPAVDEETIPFFHHLFYIDPLLLRESIKRTLVDSDSLAQEA